MVLPLATVLLVAIWRGGGPEPRPATASPRTFSSVRALSTLRNVLGEETAHPLGTEANARVRARLIEELRRLGYRTTVQSRFACNTNASCGAVQNVLARSPGTGAGRDVILLTAHYDSVGAGPGASDDGVGLATMLEAARALRGQRFRNRVDLLFTDGEEAGLLGAEAFVADEALSREVALVVNVEMRGTHGPSTMFETSTGNRWLIRQLARELDRPRATSFSYAVYQLLPNDTDVTIYKRSGKAAVNYAAVGGVQRYHTPLDDLAHVDLRTLQHHGDNVVGTVRALGNADLAARSRTDATYFDLLGFFLVWWPQEWTLWLGVISLVLLLPGARHAPARQMTLGVLTMFMALVAAALAGVGLSWVARLRSEGINFAANGGFAIAAMWLTGLAAAVCAATLLRRRAEPLPMIYGAAIAWHVIGIALALTLPGTAYLFLVPAAAVTLCAWFRAGATATAAISSTVAALLMFPLALTLYDALGGRMMVIIAVIVAAIATLAAPLFARWSATGGLTVLAVALAVAAAFQPPYDAAQPRWITFAHIDDPAVGSPRWTTSVLTPDLERAARFVPGTRALVPFGTLGWMAEAPAVAPRVALDGTRNGDRLTVRVRSSRNPDRIRVLLHGEARILRVDGVAPAPRPARYRNPYPAGWSSAVANGVDEAVVECEVRGPVEVIALDMTFGLPPSGAPLAAARRASLGVPNHDGDVTITRARARF